MQDGWIRDIVHGFRWLIKNPILSLTAVLTLTLGIAANTAIFTLLYGLILRSLPIPDAYQCHRNLLGQTKLILPLFAGAARSLSSPPLWRCLATGESEKRIEVWARERTFNSAASWLELASASTNRLESTSRQNEPPRAQ